MANESFLSLSPNSLALKPATRFAAPRTPPAFRRTFNNFYKSFMSLGGSKLACCCNRAKSLRVFGTWNFTFAGSKSAGWEEKRRFKYRYIYYIYIYRYLYVCKGKSVENNRVKYL